MLLKFIVGNLRKEQSRSFISSSSFDYRFNVVGSYKQETLKLRSFILRFSRIHLVNRYRSGFHRTRSKVDPLLPPAFYMTYAVRLQSIIKEKYEKEEEIGIRGEIKKQSPIYSFMYALKSSDARRQYPNRLKLLFDFLGLADHH
jgi:hypothetical protein